MKQNVQSQEANRRLDQDDIVNEFISKAQGDKNSALNRRQYELDMVKEYFGHAAATADEIATAKTLISKFRTGLQKGKADPGHLCSHKRDIEYPENRARERA